MEESKAKSTVMPPAVRYFFVLIAFVFGAGIMPGSAIWVNSMVQYGIANRVCDDGAQTCQAQEFLISNAMVLVGTMGKDGDKYGAAIFSMYGGRAVGLAAMAMQLIGWLMFFVLCFVHMFLNPIYIRVLVLGSGVNVSNGALMLKWVAYEFLPSFPGKGNLIMTLANSSFGVGPLMAIFLNSLSEIVRLGWLAVCIEMLTISLLSLSLITLFVPAPIVEEAADSDDEVLESSVDKVATQPEKQEKQSGGFMEALKVIWFNLGQHLLAVAVLYCGVQWTAVFGNQISLYADFLFHSPKAQQILTSNISLLSTFFCVLVGPLAVGFFPFKSIVLVYEIGLISLIYAIPQPILIAQQYSLTICAASWMMEPMCIVQHFLSFFSIHSLAMCTIIFQTLGGFPVLGTVALSMTYIGGMGCCLDVAWKNYITVIATLWGVYTIYLFGYGYPTHKVILPEMEESLCKCLLCKRFGDVAVLLNFSEDWVINTFTNRILDANLSQYLIQHIDVRAVRRHLSWLPLAEVRGWFNSDQLLWRKNFDKDGENNLSVGSLLVQQFQGSGNREDKAMLLLEKELAERKSTLVVDEIDGRSTTRLVEIVVLRLSAQIDRDIFFMTEVVVDLSTLPWKTVFRLPAVKKEQNETNDQVYRRILGKLRIDPAHTLRTAEYDTVQKETYASKSYAGLQTCYTKHHMTASLINPDQAFALFRSRALLGKNVEKAKHVQMDVDAKPEKKIFEWLAEDELQYLKPRFSLRGVQMQTRNAPVNTEEYKSLVTDYASTSKLTRILRKKDFVEFEQMMFQLSPKQMSAVIANMRHWVGSNINVYVTRLEKNMQQIISKHPQVDVKMASIEILILEIIAKKREVNNANKAQKTDK